MKFRFCGDGDCPDWVLAEIHSALSVLSAEKLRILVEMVVAAILGKDIPEQDLREIIASNNLEKASSKSSFSCLRYLLVNASRYSVDSGTFDRELQQLGLPKDHSTAICEVFSSHSTRIKDFLIENSLTVNEFESFDCKKLENSDNFQINLKIKNEIVDGVPQPTEHVVNISKANLGLLIKELETAYEIMDQYDRNE